ncbi:MAG: hypothetical protein KKD97_05550 [Gammaproteobacteria bacterium]|jgi:hypothetical protein|nr:hypothetical protein [Gammaproteobacteria bacterium]
MKRIDSANVALDLFGPGKHGFQGGNPAANLPATFFTPDWANHIQEEIANLIEYFGVALASGSRDQLLQALLANFVTVASNAGEVGKISYVPATAASVGHAPAFGVEVSRTGAYADLWAFAQASGALVDEATFPSRPGCFGYGPGGVGGTTFRVPKIPGLVIKSYHNGDGTYTTNTTALIGQYLSDEVKAHPHGVPFGTSEGDNTSNATNGSGTAGTFETTWTGGAENTVRSVVLFPQIRYRR